MVARAGLDPRAYGTFGLMVIGFDSGVVLP
jgi:hypothetical protein